MHIDYPQKQRLIEHFSQPANWHNAFDMNFFLDPSRKGSTRKLSHAVSRFTSTDGSHVAIEHKSGAALYFSREKNRVVAVDESGASFSFSGDDFIVSEGTTATVRAGYMTNAHDVPGTNGALQFDGQGNKTFIIGGQQITLPAPLEKPDIPLKKGAQIHVASITDALSEDWGIPSADLADVIKLVVARDFGIESELPAHNLHAGYDQQDITPRHGGNVASMFQRTLLTLLPEKPWADTTEFEGHDVASPQTFFVEMNDGGKNLITSLDQREAMWSQGAILRAAIQNGTATGLIAGNRAHAHQMLAMLVHGQTTRDTRGREWNYVLLETKDSHAVANKLRSAMRHEFGLTARHCSVMTYDKGLCVLAMASKVVDAAARHSAVARVETRLSLIRDAAKAAGLTPL